MNSKGVPHPRYIPKSSKMYQDLIHSLGQVRSFGMDLSLKPFSTHSSLAAAIPFFVFVAVAVGLQYFQMAQINNRNRKTGQAIPSQQQAIQRFMPILFAYIYLIIPAAVVLYMIISTVIRIITQDLMFRAGVTNPHKNGVKAIEREVPAPELTEAEEAKPVAKPAAKPAPKQSPGARSSQRPATPKPSTSKPNAQPRSRAKRKRKAR